jgi:hypothetical protein
MNLYARRCLVNLHPAGGRPHGRADPIDRNRLGPIIEGVPQPRSEERLAFEVVGRVLGVHVEHYDTAGRQAAVDGLIHLANGELGALEVTTRSAPGERELLARLAHDKFTWPNPGRWWWRIEIDDPAHLNKARAAYIQAIMVCETHGVPDPADLPWRVLQYTPAIRWLLETGIPVRGHPDVPSRTDDGVDRGVMVTPGGAGGAVDEKLEGLPAELAQVLRAEPVARRIAKLASAEGLTQRHLFLILSLDSLRFGTSYGLAFGEFLPQEAPPLPPGITHLWIATGYGHRVLLWDGQAWSQHHPYDDPRPMRDADP